MKYKGFLLATAGGVATMSGAQAADLPVKAAKVMPPPVASWEGFYVGLHAGAAWQRATGDYSGETSSEATNIAASRTSFIGGGQIGYNWQRANFVYGLEADISGLSQGPRAYPNRNITTKGNAFEANINWLSTFRARAGLLVRPDLLAYATGGLAVGQVKNTYNPHGIYDPLASRQSFTTKSVSKTQAGWTIGGGLEYMVSRNWIVGLEGLYVDLGKTTGTTVNAPAKTTSFSNKAAIGRLKVNYKF